VQLIAGDAALNTESGAGRVEIWRMVALGLLIVLGGEQLLAWLFGQRR